MEFVLPQHGAFWTLVPPKKPPSAVFLRRDPRGCWFSLPGCGLAKTPLNMAFYVCMLQFEFAPWEVFAVFFLAWASARVS